MNGCGAAITLSLGGGSLEQTGVRQTRLDDEDFCHMSHMSCFSMYFYHMSHNYVMLPDVFLSHVTCVMLHDVFLSHVICVMLPDVFLSHVTYVMLPDVFLYITYHICHASRWDISIIPLVQPSMYVIDLKIQKERKVQASFKIISILCCDIKFKKII